MNSYKTSISVKYKNAGGWHVFASDDLPGLYVASEDAKRAFDDVPLAIEKLLELNQGIKVKAEPELSFFEFLKAVRSEKQNERHLEKTLVLSSQRFSVYASQ